MSVGDATTLPTPVVQALEAGPTVEEDVTIESMSTFLAEHHTYLAQTTFSQVTALCNKLRAECQSRLASQQAAHDTTVAEYSREVEELKRQLNVAQHSLRSMIGEKEGANLATATRFLQGKRALSKRTIFSAWFRWACAERAERVLTRVASQHHAKSVKARVVSAWARLIHGSKAVQAQRRADERLKLVSAEIVDRYEAELQRQRARVVELETQVVEGRRRRSLLEDELRRTLLKGMVAMNMEALSVFSSAAARDALDDPPLPRTAKPPEPSDFLSLIDHESAKPPPTTD